MDNAVSNFHNTDAIPYAGSRF